MAPDKIKEYYSGNYHGIVYSVRILGGWSFFYGSPQKGAESNRLIRVKRQSVGLKTKLKLAATSRRGTISEINFTGDEKDLKSLMDQEIQIYLEHDLYLPPYNHSTQTIFRPD
jgi:hypothetical protein